MKTKKKKFNSQIIIKNLNSKKSQMEKKNYNN